MGAILNTLPLSETDSLMKLSPNHADWLTSHADATGLAVVEVERLWNRFRQITGSSDQSKLYPETDTISNELSNDIFIKNFLKHFPRSKTDADAIPFGYFIMAMQWIEGADTQSKLAAIFLYLNNGEPVTGLMLSKLLKHVYPETNEDEVKALSTQIMRQLGTTEKGQLNQQQFIAAVRKVIPPDELERLLHFDIIPSQLIDEVNRLPSLQSSSVNVRSTNDFASRDHLISDEQLRQIASHCARKDWTTFALALGFLEYDIEAYKVQNNYDATSAIYELLRTWREQEGGLATTNRLKTCLRQSGFEELVSILH